MDNPIFYSLFFKNKIRKWGKSLNPGSKNIRAVALSPHSPSCIAGSVTPQGRVQAWDLGACGLCHCLPQWPRSKPFASPVGARTGPGGLAVPPLLARSKWQWRWNCLPPLPLKWRIKLQLERNGAQQPALENPTHNGIKNIARGAGRAPQPPALRRKPPGTVWRRCRGRSRPLMSPN